MQMYDLQHLHLHRWRKKPYGTFQTSHNATRWDFSNIRDLCINLSLLSLGRARAVPHPEYAPGSCIEAKRLCPRR